MVKKQLRQLEINNPPILRRIFFRLRFCCEGRIAGYVTVATKPKTDKKASKVGGLFVSNCLIYTAIVLMPLLAGSALLEKFSSKLRSEDLYIIEPSLNLGQVDFPELDLSFQVEIAETQTQRTQGLMFRQGLDLNKGMLFVFAQQDVQSVWMKSTLIALDIIFMSEEGRVVSIVQGLKPCRQELCKVYSSNKKARYMLEVNAGVIEKAGIAVGQKFIFNPK